MLNTFSRNHSKAIEDYSVVILFTYAPYLARKSIDN